MNKVKIQKKRKVYLMIKQGRALLGIAIFILCLPALSISETATNNIPLPQTGSSVARYHRIQIAKTYGKLPLRFESNQGQTDSKARFLSRGSGYALYLTPTEAVMVLNKARKTVVQGIHESPFSGEVNTAPFLRKPPVAPPPVILRMQLLGSNANPQMVGLSKQPSKSNYFVGKKALWRSNVLNYKKVRLHAVYPGIDLVYYGKEGQLEYDFIVAPGKDPDLITLGFTGQDELKINPRGDLVVKIDGSEIVFSRPRAYQKINGRPKMVATYFKMKGNNQVGFKVEDYDKSLSLVIDPVLSYSTYLGGSGDDFGRGIAVDSEGNAYVVGYSMSMNFPTANPIQGHNPSNECDVFVAKLNSAGSAILYSTYLGGIGDDDGYGIAVDRSDNVYVTGKSDSTDFPLVNPIVGSGGANAGDYDAFVTKLNSAGSAIVYSTYLGGNKLDIGWGVAVDGTDNAYVSGYTLSTNFPMAAPFQSRNAGGFDAFVTKLTPTGSALVYSTYIGGRSDDYGYGIAVDSTGSAHLTGWIYSTDFPTVNPFQARNGGDYDAFLTKFNSAGSALVYSTYLGGNSYEYGWRVAVDGAGNAYVVGGGGSTNFPTVNPFQGTQGGGAYDAFVTKFNSVGTVIYSTLLGGNGNDVGQGIAVDNGGNAYIAGSTTSSNFPVMNPIQRASGGGYFDVFVAELSDNGSLLYGSYLGGGGDDIGWDIAVDNRGGVYLTGETRSSNFPTATPIQAGNAGNIDAFVTKMAFETPLFPSLTVSKTGGGTGTLTSVPDGINCGADCLESYNQNLVVALTATPNADSIFMGWSGNADCADGAVTMDVSKICTATFTLIPLTYTLNVTKAGTGTGTVISSPAGINCGTDCTESYSSGTAITLMAMPATGSIFSNWSDACAGTTSPTTVMMDASKICTATFTNTAKPTLTVTKITIPNTDTGKFNLLINGVIKANNVDNGGSTGAVIRNPGFATVRETAGTGTNLDHYIRVIGGDCATNGTITLEAGDNKTCTITNTRKPTLTVTKILIPSTDLGLFNLRMNGVIKVSNVGDGGTTGAVIRNPGFVIVSETAGTDTNLDHYIKVIGGDCAANGTITLAAGDNKTCTITNTRKPTLTVIKILIPSTDPGLFNLRMNGSIKVSNVGDGGTTGAVIRNPGFVTVSETAGTGTNLDHYIRVIGGDCAANGTITLAAGENKTCTITNTR